MDSPTETPVAAGAEAPTVSRFFGRRAHFIGIGGVGMSGLAHMLLDAGCAVSGSEPKPNSPTIELIRRGAQVSRDQLGELLSRQIDLVVRSAAVADNNPEFRAAVALGIPTLKYAQLLGQVMRERFGVAVAGTHGKSTITAMISYALLTCGADPSFVIGGRVPQLGGSSRSGSGNSFVVEACEFDRSFHNLHPRVALITNIEEDHPDCYHTVDEIVEAFAVFAARVPADGLIIANGHDALVARAIRGIGCRVETVGIGENFTWNIRPCVVHAGCHWGQVRHDGRTVAELRPALAGDYNLLNSAMAMAACAACGLEPAAAAEALGRFHGVERRMSEVGRCNGAILVDDYAHHPTALRVTLRALREKYQPRRLLCVFQPHQHSRTRCLLDDFAASFTEADQTIVPDIYFVRDSEAERSRVSAEDLVRKIGESGQEARHLADFSAIVDYLRKEARSGDVIVTMGAGNVWEIARDLAQDTPAAG